MNARNSRKIGLAGLATALVTLVIIGFFTYQDWRAYSLATIQREDSRHIISINQALLASVRDAETGQRGYLLTGQREYLEPYAFATAQIPDQLKQLAEATVNTDQVARYQHLSSLVAEKTAELSKTITLHDSDR